MRAAAALLLTLLLAACSSAPTHFFTLSVQGPARPGDAPACGGPPIAVQHVLLPGVLDRQAVVRQRGADVVEISSDDQWASPLDEMIRHVMAQDLRLNLSPAQVLLPGDAAPGGKETRLTLNVARFEAGPTGHVMLQVDWALANAGGKTLAERTETINTQAASPKTPAVVTAMSQALGELAQRIAASAPGCGG